MGQKCVSIALDFPLEFRVFFFAFIILKIRTGHKKKQQGMFLSVHRKKLVKEKKNLWGRSVFPLLLSSLSDFEFFFAFIILEILTGRKKKQQGIVLSVHRKKLVKEKKNLMGYKCVSIGLDFPLEFRYFFCTHYSRNTKRHKRKNQGMFLKVHRKIVVKKIIFISPVEVGNKKYKRSTMEKSPGFGLVS